MLVALWSSGYCRGVGGSEKMANALANGLDRRGIGTILIADGKPARGPCNAYLAPLPESTEVYLDTFPNPLLSIGQSVRFVASLWRYAAAAVRLASFFRRRRPDVVHMRLVTLDVFMLALYKRLFGYRLVITFEGTDVALARRSRLARIRVRFAVSHADAVAAVSRRLADAVDGYAGRATALCIPNGVDGEQPEPAFGHSSAVAPDHVVFCGRLHPVKQVPLLVDVFKRCVDEGCDKNFYIVGDGGDRDEVAGRVTSHGLEGRVVLTGAMQHADALAAIARARCLVLGSSDEGSPNVVLEAMALGVPVIAPNVGSLPELVRHGETGYLFPPDDVTRACEYVLRVAGDAQHARDLGTRGRGLVRQFVTVDAMVDEYLEVYRRALGTPGRPGGK